MKKSVYLDYAAATPIEPRVLTAMQPYFSERFYNPSALYQASRDTKKALNEARSSVASLLSVRETEIIFTAGGTEANNLAIRGVMEQFPGKKLLISSIEHESVRSVADKYDHCEIKVNKYGQVDLADFATKLNEETVLVSVIYASNEVGTIQNLSKIGELVSEAVKDRKKRGIEIPIYLHSDATQAAQFLNISPKRLGVDLMTLNGGKIYGPKQSGALYVKSGIKLEPIIYGGGQEKNLRSGTENIAGCIGFSVALKLARELAPKEALRLEKLSSELRTGIEKLRPDVIFHGHPKLRLPNLTSFALPGVDNERLMMELDELGFMVATGSACSAKNGEASHALLAMGLNKEVAQSTIRVTLGRGTTQADIKAFVSALSNLVGK